MFDNNFYLNMRRLTDYFPPSGYEIDFIPVGEGKKNGDAIAMRITKNGKTEIYVIDGGTQASGKALVQHIRKYYGAKRVDYLISTHPDMDHISGLKVVLEELEVGELWMHKPWEHASKIIDDIQDEDGRVTLDSLIKRIKESARLATEVEEMAKKKQQKKKIKICEPFQGAKIGCFRVLSPSKEWYIELLRNFDGVPPSKATPVLENQTYASSTDTADEGWYKETLKENGETTPRNESSVVLRGILPDDYGVLLTGDAGIQALTKAYEYARDYDDAYDLQQCQFIQMPHHGSRGNVSPEVLDMLLGPILPENSPAKKTSFVNTSKGDSDHPRKSVVNAFIRRGVEVITTKGDIICHRSGYPPRIGWGSVQPLKLSRKVEK
jgi:hydrolase (metallo-beta-lactamase superfamily)